MKNSTAHLRVAARLARAIAALIALAVVIIGVPTLMVSLNLVPHHVPSLDGLWQRLQQRDNGQLVAVVLAVGVWVCWGLFTVSFAAELVVAVLKRPSWRLPGLTPFQGAAGTLIATIVVGFALSPLGAANARAQSVPPPLPTFRTAASNATASFLTPVAVPLGRTQPDRVDASPAAPAAANPSTQTYVVQPRDTLWAIAETRLGNPLRYVEIVAMNRNVIGQDNEITPGTTLALPADLAADSASVASTRTVRVQAGDTLWSIEEHLTGNGENWHEGWAANRGRVERGGERFVDPDLIKVGWTLTIPGAAPSAPPTIDRRTHLPKDRTAPVVPPPAHTPPSRPEPGPSASSTSRPAEHSHPARADGHNAASTQNRYAVFEVGGLLAAAVFATMAVFRRRKFGRRRLGRVVAPLPADLAPLEQAVSRHGRAGLATMNFLNLALRDLAQRIGDTPAGVLPDVVGAAINDEHLDLFLASDGNEPPPPWTRTGNGWWRLSRSAYLDESALSRLAPYPCLVSIGRGKNGTDYLLDLEQVGALQLCGDAERCVDLARYIVAELANSMWADHLTATVVGLADEMVSANPGRLAYSTDARAAVLELKRAADENRNVAIDASTDVMDGRLHGTAGDAWMPHVLLITPELLSEEDTALLRSAVGSGRSAVAVVLAGSSDAGEASASVEITADGTLRTGLLPIDELAAFGLPVEDARDLARAIAFERSGTVDHAAPAPRGERAWETHVDAAGALLPECTVARPSGTTPIDVKTRDAQEETTSTLPEPDEAYLESSAINAADLAVVAPAVPVTVHRTVRESDPELDDKLAAWLDPDCDLARLRVLGPVTLEAHGRPLIRSEALCTELVAYLWFHRQGVTPSQLANDVWPRKDYAGADSNPKTVISEVRHHLGSDPVSGNLYLPRATRGSKYRLDDAFLADWDLFFRLRRRNTLPDLTSALSLVAGAPWSDLRPFGYGWLPAGEPFMYQGAIAEVALTVTTGSLKDGDTDAAINACNLALRIDPDDDRALVGLVKAYELAGRTSEMAAAILRAEAIEDPPARMIDAMRRNDWRVGA